MSKYTTQLRFICETQSGLKESSSDVNDIIQNAIPKIFDFSFPIFDESYRNVLCTKILKHYYTREIGLETYGLWKLKLDTKLNEIMPYYNKMYESVNLEYNPLYNVDMETTHSRTSDDDITRNTVTTGHVETDSENKFLDTPQGGLDGILDSDYLTNATLDNASEDTNATANETVNSTTTEEYTTRVTGKASGENYSRMIMEYRNALINVDMMIIEELKDLFFLLW